jgi:hypothetical protein
LRRRSTDDGHPALGRWYARALYTNDDALWLDLAHLTAARESLNAAGEPTFLLSTANGGSWRGELMPMPDPDEPQMLRVLGVGWIIHPDRRYEVGEARRARVLTTG